MTLPDYFDPFDFKKFTSRTNPLRNFAFGTAVEKMNEKFTGKKTAIPNVAILGVPFENGEHKKISAPNHIRRELYQLAPFNNGLKIIDLGNLKPATNTKGTLLALRDVTDYLRELNVIPVVIGGTQELTAGICEAWKNDRFFSLATVDATFDIKKGTETFSPDNYLTRIFKSIPDLFHFSLIGYQTHLTGDSLFSRPKVYGEHLRLGQLRDDFSQAEILLRNADVLSFDISAVKYADAPSTRMENPNGLRADEACQLARYAGLSPKLRTFGLFNVPEAGNSENQITVRLAAEIIWYFMEGVSAKRTAGEKTVYKVEIEGLEHPVVFLNEKATARWWFEVQSLSGEKLEVACTEKEYKAAASNEIPDRWLKFVQKMDGLSK